MEPVPGKYNNGSGTQNLTLIKRCLVDSILEPTPSAVTRLQEEDIPT